MREIRTVGVVGAGAMGAGIAQVALQSGFAVVLVNHRAATLETAEADIFKRIARSVEKGRLPQGATEKARAKFTASTDLKVLAPCDLVIEAIAENLDLKKKLFADLDGIVAGDAIIASNTSSLSVSAVASALKDRTRAGGMHFFNPAPLMRLVEVVKTPLTSPATVAQLTEVAKAFGKTPVTVSDGPGFLVNLAGRASSTEAMAILAENVADAATIDRIIRDGGGFRMGAFELMDMTGIDLNYPAAVSIFKGRHYDPRFKTTPGHALLWNAGLYGRKSGQGFLAHDGAELPAPEVAQGAIAATVPDGAGGDEGFAALRAAGVLTDGGDTVLVAPLGEDCAGVVARLGLDAKATVAVDFTGLPNRHLTLMATVGGDGRVQGIAAKLRGAGFKVEIVRDSPGFVLQRMVAMIANLGCVLAQEGVGSPADIDTAMKLALNYPKGPLEWVAALGVRETYAIMQGLYAILASDRYRPAIWLRRRALLGASIYATE